jgi:phage-related minor tail protein
LAVSVTGCCCEAVAPLLNVKVSWFVDKLKPVVWDGADTVSVKGMFTVLMPVPLNRMLAV